MKRQLLVIMLSVWGALLAQAQFKARSFTVSSPETERVATEFTTVKDTTVAININHPISGVSISGESRLFDETSLVRVLLRDNHDIDYLIYENYYPLSDATVSTFSRTAMETAVLNQVIPQSIVVEITNAQVRISGIHYSDQPLTETQYVRQAFSVQTEQLDYIVEQMNENLKKQGKLWRAKKTELSQMTYEEKKSVFGGPVPKLYGYEYYGGGIFVMPDTDLSSMSISENSVSQYVPEWDWRNRHGKNWLTSVKNQHSCGSCWAFDALGTLEAYANLYFNQNVDFDLSEQELVSCSGAGTCNGGRAVDGITYIRSHGIVSEECFPYQNTDAPCEDKCTNPIEKIYIEERVRFSNKISEDSLKRMIIRSPVGVGILSMVHEVVFAGYKTIFSGDHIRVMEGNGNIEIVVPENSELVGKTAWLVKNSWGTAWGDEGYGYFVTDMSNTGDSYYLTGKVRSNFFKDSDIVCKDEDGDGYYTWGIGNRPSSVPEWAPVQQDGDDSDYSKGPIDQYGFLEELDPDGKEALYVKSDSIIQKKSYLHNHMVINPGATLTIKGDMTFYRGATMNIKNGGRLVVDGCLLNDATISFENGGKLEVINDGKIIPIDGENFSVPQGAYMRVETGSITN